MVYVIVFYHDNDTVISRSQTPKAPSLCLGGKLFLFLCSWRDVFIFPHFVGEHMPLQWDLCPSRSPPARFIPLWFVLTGDIITLHGSWPRHQGLLYLQRWLSVSVFVCVCVCIYIYGIYGGTSACLNCLSLHISTNLPWPQADGVHNVYVHTHA